MSNLLPCPFCGGEATIDNAGGKYQAWCKHCCCIHMGEFYNTEAEAIAAWNRRTQPENKPLTLEELRQMDGEPVYCAGKINFALTGWGIVNCRDDTIVDNNGDYWDFKELGDTYLAYRAKPERSEG